MNCKIATLILFASLILTGCNSLVAESAPTTIPFASNAIDVTAIMETTESPTDAAETTTASSETERPLIDIPAGAHMCRFTSEATGDYLDYYLFIPENAVAGMPLVVFLHGDGEVNRIEALESNGPVLSFREHYGEDFPCILISPCTRQESWTNGTIPGTLMDLIGFAADTCEADTDRIIITGHSRGAMGVWYLISEYGDFFSAAVPVSCGTNTTLNYENVSKVPVYAMAGDNGKYENMYKRDMETLVSNIQAENGFAIFECLEGCGHIDTLTAAYSKTVIEWMLEQ